MESPGVSLAVPPRFRRSSHVARGRRVHVGQWRGQSGLAAASRGRADRAGGRLVEELAGRVGPDHLVPHGGGGQGRSKAQRWSTPEYFTPEE